MSVAAFSKAGVGLIVRAALQTALAADRQDHELLAGEAVAGVGAAVDHVEARDRHHVLVRGLPRELSEVLVQRHRPCTTDTLLFV